MYVCTYVCMYVCTYTHTYTHTHIHIRIYVYVNIHTYIQVDSVIGKDQVPTFTDISKLKYTRKALAEALRMYPQPPILIRRALTDDVLPLAWGTDERVTVKRGSDIFILVCI